MSESGGHLNTAVQWAALIGLVLTQAKSCIDDDRENVVTRTQVSGIELQVRQLEEERMTLGRIEERVIGIAQRVERVERQQDELKNEIRKERKR